MFEKSSFYLRVYLYFFFITQTSDEKNWYHSKMTELIYRPLQRVLSDPSFVKYLNFHRNFQNFWIRKQKQINDILNTCDHNKNKINLYLIKVENLYFETKPRSRMGILFRIFTLSNGMEIFKMSSIKTFLLFPPGNWWSQGGGIKRKSFTWSIKKIFLPHFQYYKVSQVENIPGFKMKIFLKNVLL